MVKATWNGVVLAESNNTEVVDGNHYFPPESITEEYFRKIEQTTYCGWKGTANYYDLVVDEEVNPGAAWYYADPKAAAKQITAHVAFWKGVEIEA